MIIALTGTPGTGKTTVAKLLQKKGITVVFLKDLAEKQQFISSYDDSRKTNIIDLNACESFLKKIYSFNNTFVIESHLSHILSFVETVIVLRCHPKILKKRLVKRNWACSKIRENLEAEMLDVILCESLDKHPKNKVKEIDTTELTPDNVAQSIYNFIVGKKSDTVSIPGSLDWSELMFDSSIMEWNTNGSK